MDSERQICLTPQETVVTRGQTAAVATSILTRIRKAAKASAVTTAPDCNSVNSLLGATGHRKRDSYCADRSILCSFGTRVSALTTADGPTWPSTMGMNSYRTRLKKEMVMQTMMR